MRITGILQKITNSDVFTPGMTQAQPQGRVVLGYEVFEPIALAGPNDQQEIKLNPYRRSVLAPRIGGSRGIKRMWAKQVSSFGNYSWLHEV